MDLASYFQLGKLTQIALAQKLCVKQPTINQWIKDKRPIPTRFCVSIEQATHGLVTRKDLRPDDWRTMWPELDTAAKRPPLIEDCEAPIEVVNAAIPLHAFGRIEALSAAVAFSALPPSAKKRIFDDGLLITVERCKQYQQGLPADEQVAA